MMFLTQQNAAGLHDSDDSSEKRTDPVKHMSLCHCLTQPEVKFMHTSTTNNNICIISDAQKTTALQSNVFLTLIHRLLVTNTGRSISTAQTPHSVPVFITQLHK
jgi:hypothetical protein